MLGTQEQIPPLPQWLENGYRCPTVSWAKNAQESQVANQSALLLSSRGSHSDKVKGDGKVSHMILLPVWSAQLSTAQQLLRIHRNVIEKV
ncbi:hypothetical protein AVEN_241253-1 [Araneus ventricosus]|uniref:Uncharacterized protein n=1 Tax=Araneus ventricosus TaxID=182803 RepID=A0A4Y2PFZ1_ARAVE|nr:hypothetical protein AVEN_241253-1 [Araneus ventricosus]